MDQGSPQNEQRRGLWGWVVRHPKMSLVLGFVLFSAIVVLVLDFISMNRMSRRIEAIRAKGEPVTIDDLKARGSPFPFSAEQNMTSAALRAVAPYLDVQIPADKFSLMPFLGGAVKPPTGGRIAPEELEAARWYLDFSPEARDELHKAMQIPQSRYVLQLHSPLFEVNISRAQDFRTISKLLGMESLVAAELGDRQTAQDRILDLYRSTMMAESTVDTVILALIRISILSVAEEQTERTLNVVGFDLPGLRKIKHEIGEWADRNDASNAMLFERVMFMDALQWVDSVPKKSFISESGDVNWAYVRYVPVLRNLDKSTGIGIYTKIIEALALPDEQILGKMRACEAELQNLPGYCVATGKFCASFYRFIELALRSKGATRALQLALAAEEFRLVRGRWPTKAEELVPDFLDAVPVDPFDGKPIRYSVIPEGIKTWTIGEDEKDNAGDVMRLETGKARRRGTDWGWVILNEDRRGKAASQPAE